MASINLNAAEAQDKGLTTPAEAQGNCLNSTDVSDPFAIAKDGQNSSSSQFSFFYTETPAEGQENNFSEEREKKRRKVGSPNPKKQKYQSAASLKFQKAAW